MKAAIFDQFGDPHEVLAVKDVETPEPGAGQIQIKTLLAPIHNHNVMTIMGVYGDKPRLPAIIGNEAVGTVSKVGAGVTSVKVGDRVLTGSSLTGTWAQYFLTDANAVFPVPDSVSSEVAAQLRSMPLSSYVLLDDLKVKKGDWFAFNCANGLVGTIIAQLAKERGINMIKIVRREEAKKELENLGYKDIVVAGPEDDITEEVKKLTGGADVLAGVDNIGGPAAGQIMKILYKEGRLLVFGNISGKDLEIGAGELIFSKRTVEGFWLKYEMPSPKVLQQHITDIFRLVETKSISFDIGGVFDLQDINKAIDANSSAKKGKILIKP